MSVAAFCGGKRFYQEEGEDARQLADANKRSRHQQQGSPISRCAFQHPHQTLGASVVAALHGLFPEMKDQASRPARAPRGQLLPATLPCRIGAPRPQRSLSQPTARPPP